MYAVEWGRGWGVNLIKIRNCRSVVTTSDLVCDDGKALGSISES